MERHERAHEAILALLAQPATESATLAVGLIKYQGSRSALEIACHTILALSTLQPSQGATLTPDETRVGAMAKMLAARIAEVRPWPASLNSALLYVLISEHGLVPESTTFLAGRMQSAK